MMLYFKRRARDKKLAALQASLIALLPQEDFISWHGNQLEQVDVEDWIEDMVQSRQGCEMLKCSLDDLDEATPGNVENHALREMIAATRELYSAARIACREVIDSEFSELKRAKSKRKPRNYTVNHPSETLVLS